jgi:hypothetical protein
MTDFDTFLHAIGRLTEEQRRIVLRDENVIYPPNENLGYESTPKDAVAFGAMGVDGVHYLILKRNGQITDESPVIHFSPMDFSNPYALLGHSFRQYLATVCGVTESAIVSIMDREHAGHAVLADFLCRNFDHRRLDLDGFGSQIELYSDMLPAVEP